MLIDLVYFSRFLLGSLGLISGFLIKKLYLVCNGKFYMHRDWSLYPLRLILDVFIFKPFISVPKTYLLSLRKNSDTSFSRDTRVSALTTFIFFTCLICIYSLTVSIFYVLYISPRQNTCPLFYVPNVFIFNVIFTCPTSTSFPVPFFIN